MGQREANATALLLPNRYQIAGHVKNPGTKKPREPLGFPGFLFSEGDGTRTRNHRIDSPVNGFPIHAEITRQKHWENLNFRDDSAQLPKVPT